jgi:5-methylcytosine-specific restriction endonuclease McrA
MKTCSFPNCNQKHYAKGYCRKHYAGFLRNGSSIYVPIIKTKCKAPNCNEEIIVKTKKASGYCKLHYSRIKNGTPLERPIGIKGENNPNWNNGKSEYPNHYLMKKIRKEILEESKYTCYYCGGEADRIHHLDNSKDNHSKDNLVPCCVSCHKKRHRIYDTKYKRLFGKTLKELVRLKIFSERYLVGLYGNGLSYVKERLRVGL